MLGTIRKSTEVRRAREKMKGGIILELVEVLEHELLEQFLALSDECVHKLHAGPML